MAVFRHLFALMHKCVAVPGCGVPTCQPGGPLTPPSPPPRNNLIKRRNPISTACEFLLPVLFVLALMGLWFAFSTDTFNTTAFTGPWGVPGYWPTGAWGMPPITGNGSNEVRAVPFSVLPYRLQVSGTLLAIVSNGGAATAALVSEFISDMDAMYPPFNFSSIEGCKNYTGMVLPQIGPLGCMGSAVNLNIPGFSDNIITFNSDSELNAYVQQKGYATDPAITTLYAAIVFNAGDRVTGGWDYTLRFNLTETPDTTAKQTNNLARGSTPAYAQKYSLPVVTQIGPIRSGPADNPVNMLARPGLLTLQLMVDRWILNTTAVGGYEAMDDVVAVQTALWMVSNYALPPVRGVPDTTPLIAAYALSQANPPLFAEFAKAMKSWLRSEAQLPQAVGFMPFPISAYSNNTFFTVISTLFSFVFTLAFLYPVSRLISALVYEKETRLREALRMIGVSDLVLSGAWFATYSILFAAIAIAVVIISKPTFFNYSDGGYLFLLFLLYGLSTIAYAQLVAVFFSRAKTAATVGVVIFLGGYFPYFAVGPSTYTFAQKAGSSVLSPTAFALGLDIIATLENNGVGANLSSSSTLVNNFTLSAVFAFLFFDILWMSLAAWYVDAVLPSRFREWGVPRVWYFPCTRRYWREVGDWAGSVCGARPATAPHAPTDEYKAPLLPPEEASVIEPPNAAQKSQEASGHSVGVEGMVKVFSTPDGERRAVDGVSLRMYEGEVLVLLGANGAGKTTLLTMLSGMLPCTSGKMTAWGEDVTRNLGAVRDSLGVCMQVDVLWSDLTVREHMEIYATFKGVPASDMKASIDRALVEVGMSEKALSLAGSLSGGQKRKLSVCLALVGGSKFIMLDEPTSGCDPYSRRHLWDLVKNMRDGRVVIMSTHFLDEADVLGDRIAIMADGKLKCYGAVRRGVRDHRGEGECGRVRRARRAGHVFQSPKGRRAWWW